MAKQLNFARASNMVEELKREFDPLGRGYVTNNEFVNYLATHGFGTSRPSVWNYIQLLTQLNLVKKDEYGAGYIYFVVPQVKIAEKQKSMGVFLDEPKRQDTSP
jgi:arginine repressor